MRRLALLLFGLAIALPGCGVQESQSPGEATTTSVAKECPTGECCSSISRAALLKKAPTEKSQ